AVWRRDRHPSVVWAGTMADAGSPVLYEARQLVGVVTSTKYSARLSGYNDDPTTTFQDVQSFLHALEGRVVEHAAADLDRANDDVEIELYAGGSGVFRTYSGWYPVRGSVARDSGGPVQIDTAPRGAPPA